MTQSIFADGILKGHIAFITGGGTGITGGVARALAEAGASVALVSRKMDHLQPAADAINQNGGKAIAIAADVRQPEEVEKAVAQTIAELDKVDIPLPDTLVTDPPDAPAFTSTTLLAVTTRAACSSWTAK